MVKENYRSFVEAMASYTKQPYVKTPMLHPAEWYDERRKQFTHEPETINPCSDFNEFAVHMNSGAIKSGKCELVIGWIAVSILDNYMTIQRAHAKAYEEMKVHGAEVFGEEYSNILTEAELDVIARRRVEIYEYNTLQLMKFAGAFKESIELYLTTCVYPLDDECRKCNGVKTCEYNECCNK